MNISCSFLNVNSRFSSAPYPHTAKHSAVFSADCISVVCRAYSKIPIYTSFKLILYVITLLRHLQALLFSLSAQRKIFTLTLFFAYDKINTINVFILRSARNDARAIFCSHTILANAHAHFIILRRHASRAVMIK